MQYRLPRHLVLQLPARLLGHRLLIEVRAVPRPSPKHKQRGSGCNCSCHSSLFACAFEPLHYSEEELPSYIRENLDEPPASAHPYSFLRSEMALYPGELLHVYRASV